MSVVTELIRTEEDGSLSFGNYQLAAKAKAENYEHEGDLYKVKTFREITKLERNGMFVYESVPGTAVQYFRAAGDGMRFEVEGAEDAQITVEMEENAVYRVTVDGTNIGNMETKMGGKLVISVELEPGNASSVEIHKLA